jgi:hypothetical protein
LPPRQLLSDVRPNLKNCANASSTPVLSM